MGEVHLGLHCFSGTTCEADDSDLLVPAGAVVCAASNWLGELRRRLRGPKREMFRTDALHVVACTLVNLLPIEPC